MAREDFENAVTLARDGRSLLFLTSIPLLIRNSTPNPKFF